MRKNVPLLVGNVRPATFGQDDNTLLLIDAHGSSALPRASKAQLGHALIAENRTAFAVTAFIYFQRGRQAMNQPASGLRHPTAPRFRPSTAAPQWGLCALC